MSDEKTIGWKQVPLHTVAEINPSQPQRDIPDEEGVSFLPMARVEELTGRVDPAEVRPWGEIRTGYKRFQDGDVLFAKITPSMENGKVALAEGLVGGVGAGSTEFHVVRPCGALYRRYLLHYLLQDEIRGRAQATMKGTAGQLRVPEDFLSDLEIPLPPLAIQESVVELVEKRLSQTGSATRDLDRVRANLDRYRASLLQTACEGRLVATAAELARTEGRGYESADELLNRLRSERRARWEAEELARLKAKGKERKDEGWKKKYKGPERPDTTELAKLPEGWVWASLDQLAWDSGYGTSEKCEYEGDGPPVLRIPNIHRGKLRWDDLKYARDGSILGGSDFVAPGDFLIIRTNGSPDLIGRAGLVEDPPDNPTGYASYLIRYRLVSDSTLWRWLRVVWNAPLQRKIMTRRAASSAGQYNLSMAKLGDIPVPLPPQDEMSRLLKRFDELDSRGRATAAIVEAQRKRSGSLRQAVLKRAFEGMLR